jgi:hypothetical protein
VKPAAPVKRIVFVISEIDGIVLFYLQIGMPFSFGEIPIKSPRTD